MLRFVNKPCAFLQNRFALPDQHETMNQGRRPATVLVLFVVCLPILVGMVGLVVDTGLLLAAQRHAQNAADAAALAGAKGLVSGATDASAAATAYVQNYNGLTNATVAVNNPPSSGPHAGDAKYVEIVVTATVSTWFIQVPGRGGYANRLRRAVAGYEAVQALETIAVLDAAAHPGLAIKQGTVQASRMVAVNSEGAGVDANQSWISLGTPAYAVTTGTAAVLQAPDIQVAGGVDVAANFLPLTSGGVSPLHAGSLSRADPFVYLPTPSAANGLTLHYPGINGQTFAGPQNLSIVVKDENITLAPGIFASITITGTGAGTVTLSPGVYVLAGGNTTGQALSIATSTSVTALNVLFYNTGSNFNPATGGPDKDDGNGPGPDRDATNSFGSISISAGQLKLTPSTDSASVFQGISVYQRRWNPSTIAIQSINAQDVMAGTWYARRAPVTFAAAGSFNLQFLTGSLSLSATGSGNNLTLNHAGYLGKAHQVLLVE